MTPAIRHLVWLAITAPVIATVYVIAVACAVIAEEVERGRRNALLAIAYIDIDIDIEENP